MTAVWDHSPYDGGELLVLLALADWADDQGKCWPSIGAIAQKARLTERHVYNILRAMRVDGVITAEPGGGRGRRSVYVINTAMISGFNSPHLNTEICDTETPKSTTLNPEICNKPPVPPYRKNRQEPSVKATVNKNNLSPSPSQEREGARLEDPAIVDIAEMVCERCKFTSKRTLRVIVEVLAMERGGAGLTETAERLVKTWENYRQDAEWLRYIWGPPKFFSEGHWQDNATWPYDEERLRRAREARVGT
jgi:hypothetical protein